MGEVKRKGSQSAPKSIIPLLRPLEAVQALLVKFKDQGVIIGGVAASILGTPRYTVDLDAVYLLELKDIPKFLKEAAALGIKPRISGAAKFARKNRVLLLRHPVNATDINISLGVLPFEIEMVERGIIIEFSDIKLRLPTPEDLITMKAIAHRTEDLADIHAIANNHPDLDRKRIKYWVEQFGEALDMPGLWEEIEKFLSIA